MDAFKQLVVYDKDNQYSEYASYFYGLSAFKLGFKTVAKDMFLQMRKLYPDWDQIDEVNYLLSKIYFDEREYFQALLMLKNVKSLSVAVDVAAMKRHYLSEIKDVETLKMVMEDYPEESEVARLLLKAIALEPVPGQDTTLFDSLIRKFNFNKANFVVESALVSRKKDRYSVSLLLPFLANTLDPSPIKKRNQFVLDLYEGMKMAADTLHHDGINLDLYAYDTERNAEATKKLLELDELKFTDLLVGPLFVDQAKAVLEFSEKNKISVINPVSNNSEFIGKDPFALLYQPSHETLGIRSAEILAARIKNKNCMVYFSDSPRDSVKAFSFIKRALELGIKIVWAEEIRKENSSKIFTTLATGTEFDEFKNPTEFTLKKDSIGSIYVATDDPVIYSKVISGVESRGDSVQIIGNESWIAEEGSTGNFSIYERLHILLEAPTFVAPHNPEYLDFRRKYIQKHGVIPSDYARLGYDFIRFAGRALHRYGVYFQTGLSQEGAVADPVLSGYDFKNARDNQRVPYVYFQSGVLVVAENK